MPSKKQLQDFLDENQIDMTNPDVKKGWKGWSLDVSQPEDIDSQEEIDKEFNGKFGGGKFRGHGASGSFDEQDIDPEEKPLKLTILPGKVISRVKAMKAQPAEDSATSKPITEGIDKIFAAYRRGDKKLESIRKSPQKTEENGESGKESIRAQIEKAFGKRRRTDDMEYEPGNKGYDPNPDYANIDQGAAIAAGVKWDGTPYEMRARSNEQKERSRADAFDKNYRRAHDLDEMDSREEENQLQREHFSERDRLNREHDLTRDTNRFAHEDSMHKDNMLRDDKRMQLQHAETMARIAQMREQTAQSRQDRKDKKASDMKWKLAQHIDKNQPGALQALGTLNELRNLPPSDVGLIKGGFPGWLKSEAGREVEQKAQFLYNQYTKSMFGTALSAHERERADRALGNIQAAKTVDQYRRGLDELEKITRDRLTTVYAGAGPDVVNDFLDDYSSMYSGARNPNPYGGGGQPQQPQSAPAQQFTTPDEEQEYQAWKAQFGGR